MRWVNLISMSGRSASKSNENAVIPPGAWVTWQQECFQMQPKNLVPHAVV